MTNCDAACQKMLHIYLIYEFIVYFVLLFIALVLKSFFTLLGCKTHYHLNAACITSRESLAIIYICSEMFLSFFWCSVVIWDIMPLWTGLCGPTSRLNITWRRLVTKAWTSLRTRWTVWTSVVTGSASWKCTPRPSARPSNLSSSHIWEMRSFFYKATPTHPRTYVPTYTHNSNHTVTQCLVTLHLNTL